MNFEVRTIANFDRELKRLSKLHLSIKKDLSEMVESLSDNPFQGDNLGKDCYKVRMKITSKGKGKSGGSRVITCVKVVNEQVTLLSIYDKSEQTDISDKLLIQLISDSGLS
jgi:mRNA-degrading endonuclease RelE of RelBE toxin-antitoxin system